MRQSFKHMVDSDGLVIRVVLLVSEDRIIAHKRSHSASSLIVVYYESTDLATDTLIHCLLRCDRVYARIPGLLLLRTVRGQPGIPI
jgi:hypothetical protein